jgi:peptidoglycan/LPS O-acetylase OafA/YrhL
MPPSPLSASAPTLAPDVVPDAAPGLRSRVPALDGLRALAVIGVIVFHAFPSVAPGGFAGVDVFFVLSGFLITGGLLRRTGAPWGFWVRRARRLLPALLLLVLVTGSLVGVAGGDAGVGFGGQLVAAGLFFTNWHLIAAGNSYFAETSPPVLQHLWSLAVEEQFYLVWPVLLWAICRFGSRLRTRLSMVGGLAGVSLVLMIVLAATGHTGRAYYGSDSHSFGLLAGAALAVVYAVRPALPVSPARIASTGLVGVAALLVAFRVLDGGDTSTYIVGLPAVVGITLLLVHLTVHDGGLLDRTLGVAPLRAIGERSYGLYLWHWPILELLRNAFPTMSLQHTTTTGTLAVALTGLVATASYHYVEQPIHEHGLTGWLRQIARWAGTPSQRLSGRTRLGIVTATSALTATAVVLTGIAAGAGPKVGVEQSQIEAGIQAIQQAGYHGAPATTRPGTGVGRGTGALGSPRSTPVSPPAPTGADITAIGDSVMLAAAPALLQRFPGIAINAVVSRQPTTAPGIVAQLAKRRQLRPIVLIGLGTNGYLGTGTLAAIRSAAGPQRELVFVNVFVPREWQASDNSQLTEYVAHDPHATVVDWRSAIAGHVGLLYPDHIHPDGGGGTLYAQTVAAALTSYAAAGPAKTVGRSADTPVHKAPEPTVSRRHRQAHRQAHAKPAKVIPGQRFAPKRGRPAKRRTHAGSSSHAGAHRARGSARGSGRTRS